MPAPGAGSCHGNGRLVHSLMLHMVTINSFRRREVHVSMRKDTPPVSIPGAVQDIGQIMNTEYLHAHVALMCDVNECKH